MRRRILERAGHVVLTALLMISVARVPARAIAPDDVATDAERFFETRIRPVLAESCMNCHGEDTQWSGLRLDSLDAMLKGGDFGPAVVPGDPAASLLIGAVDHTDDFVKMPPKADKLSPEVIQELTEWVRMGAPWPETPGAGAAGSVDAAASHWAFQQVLKPEPPRVGKASWVATPIDAFVLERLEAARLEPSAEAEKPTLIRRLTFDLIGLPPTPEEVEAFLADGSPEAYEKVVDRLLASPHYGERWGRHWLDVARYADTKGYVFQEERRYPYSYTYRDYVIESFNQDKPYDQFIVEQLAADLLPDDGDRGKLAALGFLTVGRRFLNKQDDILDDQIDVTTRGLLGLTVACARCHDHKYDPIPAEDYYSLHGIFASSVEPPELPLLIDDGEPQGSESYRDEHRKRTAEARKYAGQMRAEYRKELTERLSEYLAAAARLELNARDEQLDPVSREGKLRPELVRHAINQWKALTGENDSADDPLLGPWHAFASLPTGDGFVVGAAETTARLVSELEAEDGAIDPVRTAVLQAITAEPVPASLAEIARRYGALLSRAVAEPENADLEPIRARLETASSPLTIPEDPGALRPLFNRAERERYNGLLRKVAELDATHPGAPPRAMALVDRDQPVNPHVFLRGNPGRRGDEVPRRFLKVLSGPDRPTFENGSGRLELARQIASPENPLTARVLVNRVWAQHFDSPLVNTPSDFGFRSDPPSHPELLDWLAATFVEEGWSIKALHRSILLSNTYRQASLARSEGLAVDPENALLWKQNRQRLQLEPLRDAMLAVSGHLDLTMGGRSVEITEAPFSPRRTVYAFIDRQNLPGLFRTFDLASPNASSPGRYETTVPQQALFLMNSPFVAEQARHLAARLDTEAGESIEDRITTLHRWMYGREPEPREIETGLRFLKTEPPELAARGNATGWQYGYGRFDESSGKVNAFEAFPHWTGTGWQFADAMPHPEFSYLHMVAGGGHVGKDQDHASILRWVAPCDGVVAIRGRLGHESEKGDGVRGRIVSSEGGPLGEWVAHNERVPTPLERLEVTAGETIDFIVDCRAEQSFDSYTWNPAIRLVEGRNEPMTTSWNARDDFQGPTAPRLNPWERYAQVLMLTNEFVFVD